jgi:lipase chaperone LimK
MWRRALIASGTVATIAAVVFLLVQARRGNRPSPAAGEHAVATAPLPEAVAGVRGGAGAAEPPAGDAPGVEALGALATDAAGNLVLDENVRRFFDDFLTALGEASLDAIRARLEAAIDRRLPPGAARQARELLARYLAFRAAVRELSGDPGDLEARVARIRALRRSYLGEEADRELFATQDAVTDAELERRRIAAAALDQDERARRLAEVEARLPEPLRVVRERAMAPVVAMQHEEALRREGASAEDIQAYRTATFGPEAASRLAALDEQRLAWQARLDQFRAQRAQVESSISDEAARTQELARIFEAEFSPPERLRVEALERIAQHPLPWSR